MAEKPTILDESLVGIGLYTPAEAGRLTGVSSAKIRRWLRGHFVRKRFYERLWQPQIELNDDEVFLGFRDLTEVRVVSGFISAGLSAQKIRRAIDIAREHFGIERPLSTHRFRTDGTTVFLLLSEEGRDQIVDVFSNQLAMRQIIEPSFRGFEFNSEGEPIRWKVARGVVIDPDHSFGQPVEEESLVPTYILAAAAGAEGSPEAAAAAFDVPVKAVKQAVDFENKLAA